jgi:DnaJ-class molecular chaperone
VSKKSFDLIHQALKELNLPSYVSLNEIKERYRELSKEYHPDINEENSKMVKINEAYSVLKSYAENFRFTFSEEEISKQFPESDYATKFRI